VTGALHFCVLSTANQYTCEHYGRFQSHYANGIDELLGKFCSASFDHGRGYTQVVISGFRPKINYLQSVEYCRTSTKYAGNAFSTVLYCETENIGINIKFGVEFLTALQGKI